MALINALMTEVAMIPNTIISVMVYRLKRESQTRCVIDHRPMDKVAMDKVAIAEKFRSALDNTKSCPVAPL
jgi:hypothetical protein